MRMTFFALAAAGRVPIIEPGQTVEVVLSFGAEAFRRWSAETGAWTIDPGRYQLLLGASASDIRSTLEVGIQP